MLALTKSNLIFLEAPDDEREVVRQLERLTRDFVEPAAKF